MEKNASQPNRQRLRWLLIGLVVAGTVLALCGGLALFAFRLGKIEEDRARKDMEEIAAARRAADLPAAPSTAEPDFDMASFMRQETLTKAMGVLGAQGSKLSHENFSLMMARWFSKQKLEALSDGRPAKSIGLVLKDTREWEWNTLCVSGSIMQIERGSGLLFNGLLMNSDPPAAIYFDTMNSTGELVSGSQAKFCGVIVGKWKSPSSIHMSGMFDLPENRKR